MKHLKVLLIITIISVKGFSQCGGSFLWNLKTTTDNVVINTTPILSDIDSLVGLKRPLNADKPNRHRLHEETQTYTITGKILYWMLEADKDIHLAVQSLTTGVTMVCEIPDPNCPTVKSSPYIKKINDARNTFLHYRSGNHAMKPGVYQLTGVLFYDKPHHAIGANDKHVELHPVFKMIKIQESYE